MKNTIVKDAVSRLITQARVDERFRADFEKEVGSIFDTAEQNAAPVIESAPFTNEEISAVREILRTIINRPTVGPV